MKQREFFFNVLGVAVWALLIIGLGLESTQEATYSSTVKIRMFLVGLGFFLLAWRNNAGAEAYVRHRRTLIMMQRILDQLERLEGVGGTGTRTKPD